MLNITTVPLSIKARRDWIFISSEETCITLKDMMTENK